MPVAQHRATLDDVARAAGVHRSTVSLALRDHPRIPADTRARVKATARALGYRADPLVSALMQMRRSPHAAGLPTLAYLETRGSSGDTHGARTGYCAGAAARAREFGFRLQRVACDRMRTHPQPLSDRLSRQGVRGVLIDSIAAPGAIELEWERFSCVALGPAPTPLLHHVAENVFAAVSEVMEHCHQLGYRRIGLARLNSLGGAAPSDRELGAYTIQQRRHSPRASLPVCPTSPATCASFREWLLVHRPDAILTDAPAVLRGWLRRLGWRVPDDVGLVTVRAEHDADCTGIYCHPSATGALAVDMLLGLMHRKETGVPRLAHEILLGGEWREHGTLRRCVPASALPALRASRNPRSNARLFDNARVAVA